MTALPVVKTINAHTVGRYLVQPPLRSGPVSVLIGFHGYGENADQHLRELSKIPTADEWLLVSVQALHQFYDRKSGTVVGCWMTSQDREQMIADNLAYIDSIVTGLAREHETTSTLVYSGFSQGVAMAYRAAVRGRLPATGVIALAGDVPPELRADAGATWPNVLLGRGTQDSWYTQGLMNRDVACLERMGALFDTVVFDGGHEWHNDFRAAAGRLLQSAHK